MELPMYWVKVITNALMALVVATAGFVLIWAYFEAEDMSTIFLTILEPQMNTALVCGILYLVSAVIAFTAPYVWLTITTVNPSIAQDQLASELWHMVSSPKDDYRQSIIAPLGKPKEEDVVTELTESARASPSRLGDNILKRERIVVDVFDHNIVGLMAEVDKIGKLTFPPPPGTEAPRQADGDADGEAAREPAEYELLEMEVVTAAADKVALVEGESLTATETIVKNVPANEKSIDSLRDGSISEIVKHLEI